MREIRTGGAALIVLNSMVGAGIFALPAAVASSAGELSPWLFAACGLLISAVVLTYCELASYFRESGGPALYAGAAFGPFAGFCAGWFLYLSRTTAFAANSTIIVMYLETFWPWLSQDIGRAIAIFVICSALTWINYIGVKDGVRAISVLTLFKITPLVLLILAGLPHVSRDILLPSEVPTIQDPGGTMLLLIYAFIGFEAGTITAGETDRPRRTLPRVLVVTVIATAVFYFLLALVYVAVSPMSPKPDATLVDIGGVLAGTAGILLITAAAVFSIGGNLASNMLTVPRLSFALARDGMLPEWFGRIHGRYATPANSILFFGFLTLVFGLSGSFAWLAAASSLTRLLVYLLCIGALPVIRRRADPEARANAFHLKGGYFIPGLAFALCLWVTLQATASSWQVTLLLVLAGLLLFLLARKSLSKP